MGSNSTTSRLSAIRTRWAAIGAAVAVTLGAGTIATVDAIQTSGERLSYTAITPCRLMNTRPGPNQVGPRTTPLQAGVTVVVDARGAEGNCTATDLPSDAKALQLNVTPVNATADTDITIWPEGDKPQASSVNPRPGPPDPNAVTMELASDGSFRMQNKFGTIDMVIDVLGFYRDHNHDDRYYTKDEIDDGKFLPINVYADAGLSSASPVFGSNDDMGIGTQFPSYNVTLPPDYTAGTDLTLRVLAYSPDASCTARVSADWIMAVRAGQTSIQPSFGPSAIEMPIADADVTELFEFTIGGDGLEPLDGLGFGLFRSGGAGQCQMVFAALGLVYD